MEEEYTGEEYTEELDQDYTDKDMQVVTQLAYMNFDKGLEGKTIGQIMDDDAAKERLYDQFMRKYNDDKDSTKSREAAEEFFTELVDMFITLL